MSAHRPVSAAPRGPWRARAAALAACCLAATPAPGPAPERALVVVRTLVMDALGTRTVDTDTARIPFGSRGLLIKRVPYAGPPLSYRLAVLAGPPQETGIPLTMTSEVWNGDAEVVPPPDQVAHREEATVLSAEGS